MGPHVNVENVHEAIAEFLCQQGCKDPWVLRHNLGGLLLRESCPL